MPTTSPLYAFDLSDFQCKVLIVGSGFGGTMTVCPSPIGSLTPGDP